ncbi:MAG: fused MFS/spermidine synthase [Elusimicrobia bacterium]|nr:fused MFS/spermidine synthase [Elusimicrobiota bacterium]
MTRDHRQSATALKLAAFGAGLAGLVFELAWLRLLALSVGNTAEAACALLSVYMAGLALGSWVLGRRADRVASGPGLFAGLQAAVALCGAAMPVLISGLPPVAAALCLLVPTFLMGGALPLLARQALIQGGLVAEEVGSLCFWNTLGGAAGAVLAGFVLLPALGLRGTVGVAVLVSLAVGALAWKLSDPAAAAPPEKEALAAAQSSPVLWAVFALSGLCALAYETLWTRLLSLVLGSSLYAFTIMLAAFLAGLALGGRLAGPLARRGWSRWGVLGLLQSGIAVCSLAGLLVLPWLPFVYLKIYAALGPESAWFLPAQFGLAFTALLPAALLMGLNFPWCADLAGPSARPGSRLGAMYALNTAGAAAAPWLASLLLIPRFGLAGSVAALALVNLVLGLLALSREPKPAYRVALPWVAVGVLVFWWASPLPSRSVLESGVMPRAADFLARGNDIKAWRTLLDSRREVFSEDGRTASVSVWKHDNGTLTITLDGKPDASTSRLTDMPTQVLSGHLPPLLREARAGAGSAKGGSALVIGLGSGITVGALARHPLERIEVVEIEPAVVRASRAFADFNHAALSDPRVSLVLDDARRYLRRASRSYDIVISEPSNPWLPGSAALFTREFYESVRVRLASDGIFCQWLHFYGMPTDAVRAELRTFRSVFPHASLWWPTGGDVLLVATPDELKLDYKALSRALAGAGVQADLAAIGFGGPEGFLTSFAAGEKVLAALAQEGAGLNTDDRPILEFAAARSVHDAGAFARNAELLNARRESVSPYLEGFDRPRELARAYGARGLLALGAAELEKDGASLKDLTSRRETGEMYLKAQDFSAAVRVFAELARSRPRDPKAQLDLARACLAAGEKDKGLAAMERFAGLILRRELVPLYAKGLADEAKPAPAYLALGQGYARLQEGRLAAKLMTLALQNDPKIFDAMIR